MLAVLSWFCSRRLGNAESFPFDALSLKPETSHLKPCLADALNLKPETAHLKPCLADALNLKPETAHLKPCLALVHRIQTIHTTVIPGEIL